MKAVIQSTNEQPLNVDSSFLLAQTFELLGLKNEGNDPLMREKFVLNETALFAVSSMHGIVLHQYLDEIGKENPDEAKVRELKENLAQIDAEQDLIYSGDEATKLLVISKYGSKIKEAIQAQAQAQNPDIQPQMDSLSHGR